jgi:metal-responsive CopG/Arc/MetJ family transcriptional regulator
MPKKVKATKRARGRPISVGATQTVTMTMPPALVATMDAWAAKAGVTRSEAARRLIELGLKRAKV